MPDAAQGAAAPSARRATTFHLVFLTYSVVCSGAYGLEEMISTSGPGLALTLLLVLPIVWGLPISLACAELSSLRPVEGGYYAWVREAFGDFVGYQAGWLVWIANLATNAAFAVLFANYLKYYLPGLGDTGRWLAALALVWGTTILNCFGIRLVGATSVVMTILIFLPFLGLSVGGLLHWSHAPFVPFAHPDKTLTESLTGGLMIALWLYGGYEKLTPNAAEVQDAARAFPLALAIALPMVVSSYVIPTVAGLAACGGWRDWGEAHFTVLAQCVSGPVLAVAMSIGGLISNACILMVTILGQSRLPMVLAQDGLFPRPFARVHRRFGTPILSLVAGGVLLSLLCRRQFKDLAALFTLVQVLAYVLICAALLRLRSRHPPGRGVAAAGSASVEDGGASAAFGAPGEPWFRVPLGATGLALMTAPVFALSAYVVFERFFPAGTWDLNGIGRDLLMFATGPVTYLVFRRRTPPAASNRAT